MNASCAVRVPPLLLFLGLSCPATGTAPPSAPTWAAAEQSLRGQGLEQAAAVLHERLHQRSPKMRIEERRAWVMAGHLARLLPTLPGARQLLEVMPRATVELVVAVAERGVSPDEAERIAGVLLEFTARMRLGNLRQFDINYSHIVGRDWPDIDYRGEGTTWQQRQREWARQGVVNFQKAVYLERYLEKERTMGYFRRIYRPGP